MSARFIDPVVLKGRHATLEPLGREHEEGLRRAASDGDLWRLWYTSVASPEKMGEYVATALDMRERLGAMPFVVRDNASGRCIAVEFRTHWFNHASREAILRLGAKQDGVLRNHQIAPDGAYRDTVVFSIIESEWAAVKRHLQFQLERPR